MKYAHGKVLTNKQNRIVIQCKLLSLKIKNIDDPKEKKNSRQFAATTPINARLFNIEMQNQ